MLGISPTKDTEYTECCECGAIVDSQDTEIVGMYPPEYACYDCLYTNHSDEAD